MARSVEGSLDSALASRHIGLDMARRTFGMPGPAVAKAKNSVHEVGIMQSTLALAQQQARASGAERIHELRLRIGQLSGVVPDALSYAFEVLRQDTMAAEAQLKIESVPASCWCSTCEREFEAEDLIYECPGCGELSGELRRGTEMELASMEVS